MRSIFIYSLKALKTLRLQVTELQRILLGALEQAYAIHSNMCSGSWSWSSSSRSKKHRALVVVNLKRRRRQQLQKTTRPHVSVAIRRKRLRLRRLRAGVEAMEIVNLKLYLENRCIIAENERLRERATALRRENLALLQNLSKTTAAVPEAGAGAA